MPLQPPSNPFDYFSWLKEFNAAILRIIEKRHTGFSCEPFLAAPEILQGFAAKKSIYCATGNYNTGYFWMGF